jgi:hypothetical protein
MATEEAKEIRRKIKALHDEFRDANSERRTQIIQEINVLILRLFNLEYG